MLAQERCPKKRQSWQIYDVRSMFVTMRIGGYFKISIWFCVKICLLNYYMKSKVETSNWTINSRILVYILMHLLRYWSKKNNKKNRRQTFSFLFLEPPVLFRPSVFFDYIPSVRPSWGRNSWFLRTCCAPHFDTSSRQTLRCGENEQTRNKHGQLGKASKPGDILPRLHHTRGHHTNLTRGALRFILSSFRDGEGT